MAWLLLAWRPVRSQPGCYSYLFSASDCALVLLSSLSAAPRCHGAQQAEPPPSRAGLRGTARPRAELPFPLPRNRGITAAPERQALKERLRSRSELVSSNGDDFKEAFSRLLVRGRRPSSKAWFPPRRESSAVCHRWGTAEHQGEMNGRWCSCK